MRGALALWVVVGLAACDARQADDGAVGASDVPALAADTRGTFAAAAPSDAVARAPSSPEQAPASITLTLIGEIELPDGGVQRNYRAVLQPGSAAATGLRAELISAGAGHRVIQGLARFDAAARGPVTADRTVQIVQPDMQLLDPAALRWLLTPLDPLQGVHGALLPGEPDALATQALREYRWSAAPGGPGTPNASLAAVLRADAQVRDVNQVLRETGLRIAAMRSGNHTLELRTAGSAGHGGLQPLARRLQASRAFESVRMQVAAPAATAELPTEASEPDACDY